MELNIHKGFDYLFKLFFLQKCYKSEVQKTLLPNETDKRVRNDLFRITKELTYRGDG